MNWEQREDLIVQARVAPLTQHGIFADLVCLEERISDEYPFSIDQLFKQPTDDTHMTFYDKHLWKKDNVHGKSSMQPLIEEIILRTVQYYDANRWADARDGKAHGRFKAWGHMMRFRNVTFLKDVAEYIRIRLRCDRWELDPLSSDRYLNFDGGKTYDSLDDRWLDTHPDMRISLTTGWTYQGHLNGSPEQKTLKQRLVTAIQAVAEEHSRRPLDEPFVMSPELESEFDELAKEFAPLRLFYDWVQEWGVVMYLLQHLARATFAVKMAEALIVWSSGRSGKDTTVNMMETILGSTPARLTTMLYVDRRTARVCARSSTPPGPSGTSPSGRFGRARRSTPRRSMPYATRTLCTSQGGCTRALLRAEREGSSAYAATSCRS